MAEWYYEFNGAQQGPVSQEALLSLMQAGTVVPQGRVWREGMADWAPAATMPELAPPTPAPAIAPVAVTQTIPLTPPAGQLPPVSGDLNYYNPVANQTFVYAGFWLRFVAYLIDFFVVFAFQVALAIIPLGGIAALAAGWLYFAIMESSDHQATLGKMALGLVVTDLQGRQITFGRATGRYFGKILSAFIFCIGFMMAGFTERKQALHDMLAGALVVRKV